jgi:prepilin peptidase CpaA
VTGFEIAAVLVGLAGCTTDIASRRVPNALTMPAVGLGVAAHAVAGGWPEAWGALLGGVVGLAVFLPIFALGGMGGGDVKLMAALGSWIGAGPVVWTAIYAALAGGVLALGVSVAHGYLGQALGNIRGLFVFWAVQGLRPMPALTLAHGIGPRLPYALPIFVGLLVTLWRH